MKNLTGAGLMLAATLAGATGAALPDPRLHYRSAFQNPPPRDARPADWRDSNEQMRRLGGHAGHLRGTPPAAAAPAAAPASSPAAGAHAQHHGARP